ncbi:L-gulonolactone/D-arabinono-1,4-lactone oxidase [Wolfiporia cocos MD-104 SS10]|uniref:D-arabinono-1,4-lactone oxidase n=1 Tax=Wolfiporia cocos (strain MD-104) TaxID=742152 RepID=A0A2H3JLE7_WOLCO|nr:L-gulonolactone/D-arabinono-1,4-lactone oxidase [Wolfiporia cocos MD-104 SS10]
MAPDAPPVASLPRPALDARLAPITVPAGSPRARFVNWGRSYTCAPLAVFEPRTEYECELVLELARRERRPVRAAGVGHSPSDLACTDGYMLRTEKLSRVIEVDTEKQTVTAQGGITLHALHAALAAHGLAMSNLGSISDQTLAGMVTTATHGSGLAFPVLSTYVRALVLLLPSGARVVCSEAERADLFRASLCGLGSTGVILRATLQCERAFRLRERQETRPFDDVVAELDAVARSAEHVRLWWFPQADAVRVARADRTAEPPRPAATWLWHSLLGYHLLQLLFFLGRFTPALNPHTARFGAWLDSAPTVAVDDSHKIFNVDCKYPQFTTEWAVPYARAGACLRALRAWLDEEHADPRGLRPHFPIEVRFTAPDDVWMSPSAGQATCWIGIIQYKPYGLNVPYRALFARFEAILAAHGGRPHWAKAHGLRPAQLRALYPRFDDFVRVLRDVDPDGMLRNAYVRRHVFGEEGPRDGERVFKARP